MPAEQDFAFLVKHHANKTDIYVVADTSSRDRIPPRAEQYASYVVSNGKLTIKDDQYDAIAQPEIYERLMMAIERNKAKGKSQPYLVADDRLSDYMDGQIED